MGIGYATTEYLSVENGVVKNPCFRDYKVMTAPEIPDIDMIFIETMDPEGPAGAKGVGEAPMICTAPAIAISALRMQRVCWPACFLRTLPTGLSLR